MEENIGLLAVDGDVGCGPFGDGVWWGGHVLGLFVIC